MAVFVGVQIYFLNMELINNPVYNDVQSNVYLPGWTSPWRP